MDDSSDCKGMLEPDSTCFETPLNEFFCLLLYFVINITIIIQNRVFGLSISCLRFMHVMCGACFDSVPYIFLHFYAALS